MKIAIFDHLVQDDNAIGKCHRELLTYLADEHEFTVFALEFDNPRPDRIDFIKVPALRRPLLGLMVSFHIIAPFMLWWHRRIKGKQFDIVQGIGGNFLNTDLAYGHFCHRVYLKEHLDARPKGIIRRAYSWLYDSIVSMLEPYSYGHARYIVTPSRGLARELERHFRDVDASSIHVISNPIDVSDLHAPAAERIQQEREKLGFDVDDLVLVFVAAGHFERKGLPVLLDAIREVNDERVKLLVVGGRPYLIEEYQAKVDHINLSDQVLFVGFQNNIPPYLWASDIFAFPSSYETFSLVSFEAAGAGLPLLVPQLYGVEEFVKNDHNGWIVERTPAAYAEKIRFALDHRATVAEMGDNAMESVRHYTSEAFGERWKSFYEHIVTSHHSVKVLRESSQLD